MDVGRKEGKAEKLAGKKSQGKKTQPNFRHTPQSPCSVDRVFHELEMYKRTYSEHELAQGLNPIYPIYQNTEIKIYQLDIK